MDLPATAATSCVVVAVEMLIFGVPVGMNRLLTGMGTPPVTPWIAAAVVALVPALVTGMPLEPPPPPHPTGHPEPPEMFSVEVPDAVIPATNSLPVWTYAQHPPGDI